MPIPKSKRLVERRKSPPIAAAAPRRSCPHPSSPLLTFLSSAAFLGSVLGYTLGLVNQNLEKQAASMPNKPPTMQGGSFSGPPKVLALNLAVFSAVQSGLTLAVKKYRGVEGNDDIPSNMAGMFGAGMSLSLCTNLVGDAPAAPGQTKPTTPAGYATDAVRTGALFACLNGAFMKVGQMFTGKNATTDVYYYHTNGMLAALGLEKYEKNFKRGLLTDDTLALLSDSALKEIKIPPGPRLKILNYVEASKKHMAAYAQTPPAYAQPPAQEQGTGMTHA
jgi:hypothetical protein